MTGTLEDLLREATVERPSPAADGNILAAIRHEAALRRRRRLSLRLCRGIAAAVAAILVAANLHVWWNGAPGGDAADIDEGDIALDIIGFASPCDFYAED